MQLNEERRIQPLLFEKGGVAVFVNGMQGLTVITSMEEVVSLIHGGSSQMPVFTLAELATPRDTYQEKVVLAN